MVSGRTPKKTTGQYLRGDRSGLLSMRRAGNRDAAWDVRLAADRASALALDFMRNSGWLAGAADQIIADTIGEELKLNARPDLLSLGYNEADRAAWCREVEAAWRRWSWDAREVDLAGRSTFSEILDGVIRHYLVHGEAFGVLDYLTVRGRRGYGIETGTKVSLISPHRLPRITREFEGLEDGIFHDANGRPTMYRFRQRSGGMEADKDVAAKDVIHVMDHSENPGAPRGISVLAPIMKVIAQYDQLADATLATALMQTIFAATITSPEPSEEAFQAIQTLADTGDVPPGYDPADWEAFIGGLQADLYEVWGQRISALKEHGIALSDHARINHLGPGEKFELHTTQTPGAQYVPYSQNLQREIARRLGVMFESLTLDFSRATYSSVRMGISSIWPIVLRRRLRIAGAFADRVYQAWLDEQIGTGRIGFRGGYQAFLANRSKVQFAEWQGPSRPSADDWKTAQAAGKRLELGITSLADECAAAGLDWEENAEQIAREMKLLTEKGIPHPFGRKQGGAGGPLGGSVDGEREPAGTGESANA
ncbi:phage portal protein [Acuticoccus sediminis]|uniref:Phage portal protein n=2 Tax=Acuticoccus sediminis TaxID=2184697 RepID=A0A8B2NXL0_9HYPH|nr:phage portal protein [Acuticoccus sediminis]